MYFMSVIANLTYEKKYIQERIESLVKMQTIPDIDRKLKNPVKISFAGKLIRLSRFYQENRALY